MTQPTPPADLLDSLMRALEPTFRLDDLVALSPERALYRAWDRLLKRSVALRVHLVPGGPGRAWFLRESETLAALDHAAIRHVYAAWTAGDFAYRTANWIEGESLADAMGRGPAPALKSPARPRGAGPAVPAVLERVLLRALQPQPGDRYFTATEMLEDFVSDAGVYQEPAAAPQVVEAGFERRLRRALGDDYELLDEIGSGGFRRVFRARDPAPEREVALQVPDPS